MDDESGCICEQEAFLEGDEESELGKLESWSRIKGENGWLEVKEDEVRRT